MILVPISLEHGERYGRLTVLGKTPSGKYRVGCECGFAGFKVRAKALMSGRVKACRRCSAIGAKSTSGIE